MNMVVSGGAGSGKTTLLGVLCDFVPDEERLITIEDAAELRIQKPHVLALEARPSNVEGRGEVTIRDLVRNALRMRPDRIIVGEVRGGEALDMLQAMNTGHEGSLSTAHANPRIEATYTLPGTGYAAATGTPEMAGTGSQALAGRYPSLGYGRKRVPRSPQALRRIGLVGVPHHPRVCRPGYKSRRAHRQVS
jgi:Flp pilus assembly CpaF family ATPase